MTGLAAARPAMPPARPAPPGRRFPRRRPASPAPAPWPCRPRRPTPSPAPSPHPSPSKRHDRRAPGRRGCAVNAAIHR
ncbi:hypothetical protein L559_1756 [Bordetella pertussis STO1-CHOC-0017]|nr:hypothetical protein L559_1756 [Bordetella pertussis STO1-CHOC-0017]